MLVTRSLPKQKDTAYPDERRKKEILRDYPSERIDVGLDRKRGEVRLNWTGNLQYSFLS